MAEASWARAVAGVFVEARPLLDRVDNEVAERRQSESERHLVAAPQSQGSAAGDQSASPPLLLMVSLIDQPTRAELQSILEVSERMVGQFDRKFDAGSARILLAGVEDPRRWRRRSGSRRIEAPLEQVGAAVREFRPHAVIADASGFQNVPVGWLSGGLVVGLSRKGDNSAYAGLFSVEARERFPNATVWVGTAGDLELDGGFSGLARGLQS